jgi:hypothetical protein
MAINPNWIVPPIKPRVIANQRLGRIYLDADIRKGVLRNILEDASSNIDELKDYVHLIIHADLNSYINVEGVEVKCTLLNKIRAKIYLHLIENGTYGAN